MRKEKKNKYLKSCFNLFSGKNIKNCNVFMACCFDNI